MLLKDIKGLVQVRGKTEKPLKGKEMQELPVLENAWLLMKNGLISDYGTMDKVPDIDTETIDCTGRFVFPSYVDSHTHLVFAGSREHEFEMRIKGASYEEISKNGGGILNSASRLAHTSEDILVQEAEKRLQEIISLGTGAVEIKSGYGLSLESEVKILRVVKRIKEKSPIPVKATFLGAHAFPLEYKNNRIGYINLIINEMLPAIGKENFADYIDVFCDKGFFTPEETDIILKAGIAHGLIPRLHANELANSGGVQVGVANKAVSVDHLEYIGDEEIKALINSDTMPTLLPSTAFFLNLPYAPARKLIDSGLPVALASDYNPGTSPSGNMNFTLSLACLHMKMTPEEAINAATINSASTLQLLHSHGSITRGKAASVFITKPIPSYAFLPYSFGSNLIETVILKEKVWKG